ncbi:hypothetical protein SAMN02745248_01540 [Hathewaya proteolytica DSM 3090]|uniref:Uncharacterized protein n=1 Tax=Hathewaya proteolytica DSM 3090 TaxID=1121331 RepID=A0A1M6NXF8_9CLOT|nr:hypothetical protein [Hathewaya proteolytica]SHK00330.1 hypothetical protein SAMN02745248_01540 [Hathewaya proteolytica DSM 3090]
MRGTKSVLTKVVIFIDILLLICVAGFAIYYFYFYPQNNSYESMNKSLPNAEREVDIEINPENIDIPSKEITVLSSINFSEEELTDLFLLSLKDMPEVNQYIRGLKVRILDDCINLDANVTYKNLPLKATFTFQGKASNGKGILHYHQGKIGFLDIPENVLLSNLKDTTYLKVSQDSKDIILDLSTSEFMEITDIVTENKSLKVKLRKTISLLK